MEPVKSSDPKEVLADFVCDVTLAAIRKNLNNLVYISYHDLPNRDPWFLKASVIAEVMRHILQSASIIRQRWHEDTTIFIAIEPEVFFPEVATRHLVTWVQGFRSSNPRLLCREREPILQMIRDLLPYLFSEGDINCLNGWVKVQDLSITIVTLAELSARLGKKK